MMNDNLYIRAVSDFRDARRKAAIQEILGALTGNSNELLSYETVRQQLRAIEGNKTELRDIPLDAIVGSVGRYSDFTRGFLPRRDSDQQRWAGVMSKTTNLIGLPPIEVYQIGETYFVLDGNHRVSVAQQLGATTIQAYVTEVRTRVNITPETSPDELIIKAELTHFLEQTQLDRERPASDFTTTNPGQYPILLEHIAVHQYFMGIDEQRNISYEEAITHWHDDVYQPVKEIIQERGILQHFPERTETDLYLWISRHRADLENELEQHISSEAAAADLKIRFNPEFSHTFGRLISRVLDAVIPDALESGPPPGNWREETLQQKRSEQLFANILVTLSEADPHWMALEQAIVVARREQAQIQGLRIIQHPEDDDSETSAALHNEFIARCESAGVHGHLTLETGSIARAICKRAYWTDLIVSKLTYPPGDDLVSRLGSGLRTMIRRCPRPILIVPDNVTPINRALLAYNGTPKAKEGLYASAYLAGKWGIELHVLTIEHPDIFAKVALDEAKRYLIESQVEAHYHLHENRNRADILLEFSEQNACDMLIMGGYKASPLVEVMLGSVVDEVLRRTEIPLLICR